MHDYTFSSLAEILSVVPLQQVSNPTLDLLLTDSRKLQVPENTIFFSISSPLKNANDFVLPLYNREVRCFIVDDHFNESQLQQMPEANVLRVKDVLKSLQEIVSYHRSRFNIPVIGITGSNGKTIVKEWLNQLLYSHYNIVRSPKSFNSQLGVPLSVWQMNETHTLGIFEAGISQPGEMCRLEKIISPDIGIFTYAGDAHASGFTSLQQKVNEKLQLFINSKVLIYCKDDPAIDAEALKFKATDNTSLQLFNWSFHNDATLLVEEIVRDDHETIIKCVYNRIQFDFKILYTDDASIHNAICCVCVLLLLDTDMLSVKEKMLELKQVEMRLELKQGINNTSVINDSYSSDLNSLNIALDFLEHQPQHAARTLILSDILQTGRSPEELYKRIAGTLVQKKVSKLIGIGPEISQHKELFSRIKETYFYPSTDVFMELLPSIKFFNETILLKGARKFGFERIGEALEEKKHETMLEINLNALRHNLKVYGSLLDKKVRLMVMVKAFSYGSGSFEIANVLQQEGVDYLAVAYADEGVKLRQAGIRVPIMVMNVEEAGFENLLKYELEPELYSFKIAFAFIKFLSDRGILDYPVHIKLDTGMHRLGFEPANISMLINLLQQSKQIKIYSVFSHLAASGDEEHDKFTDDQSKAFISMAEQIEESIGYNFLRHLANTSAIHRHPELQMDMVRLGIGLYGVDSDPSIQRQLQNVTTMTTTISQIKKISPGESVGYSRRAIVQQETTIATVRVGYADGYPRKLSNGNGKMLVNGRLAPVIGSVCMDMTMLDISGIPCREGDDVIVFGEFLPVSHLAIWAETIPYEMLTGISQRVKRIYFEE